VVYVGGGGGVGVNQLAVLAVAVFVGVVGAVWSPAGHKYTVWAESRFFL
jgi:hypothetical protein